MNFEEEFDAIFRDIVGNDPEKITLQLEKKLPEIRMKEFYSDLVRFAEQILEEDKLQMYGIHHALHYIAAKRAEYERGSKFKCSCGKEYTLKTWNDTGNMSASLRGSLRDKGYLFFSPEFREEIRDRRWCPFCGQVFITNGLILSMKCEGVDIE